MLNTCVTRFLAAMLTFLGAASATIAGVPDAFELPKGAPTRILIVLPDAVPPKALAETRMERRLQGVLEVLDRARFAELRKLEQTQRIRASASALDAADRLWYVWLSNDEHSLRVKIHRGPDGAVFAERGDDPDAPVWLHAERLRAFERPLPAFRGDFDPLASPIRPGQTADLPLPYTPGRFTLDARTLSERLYGGKRTRVAAVSRDIGRERLIVRPPAGYDPAQPAGLVVWVDPTDRGPPPPVLHAVCDELNLVAIGAANNGNGRPFVDRMQLVLDVAATAQARFHIDPDRVYLVGFSGGGRISSMMIACFPDLFAGAVPIGGLNHSRPARTADGKTWPKTYERPRGQRLAQLRTRRVAPITGPDDFNYEQMLAYAKGWEQDRVPFLFFDVPGMGHTMPPPTVMAEALRWVDEPWRRGHAAKEARAQSELERVLRQAQEATLPVSVRLRVVELANEAAWTETGTRALDALNTR
ncbi:MAG: PHB depolymerase family esterase [Planctomycetota bacterium]